MKTSTKIALGLTAALATGVVIYVVRKRRFARMLQNIADEGYETARDILYPHNGRDRNLHYGPVVPR